MLSYRSNSTTAEENEKCTKISAQRLIEIYCGSVTAIINDNNNNNNNNDNNLVATKWNVTIAFILAHWRCCTHCMRYTLCTMYILQVSIIYVNMKMNENYFIQKLIHVHILYD